MEVFISWSRNTGRHIAEALRHWLPMAIQAVKPYMNQRDNEAGVRWEEVVSAELKETDFGILCHASGTSVLIGWSVGPRSGTEDALDLARRCVAAWEAYLKANGLQSPLI